MATGVPKKRAITRSPNSPGGIFANSAGQLRLDYSGKKPDTAILATSPSETVRLWPREEHGRENELYFGENLGILAALLRRNEVAGKVRLVYIDPPYATQTTFHSRTLEHAYEDTLSAGICGVAPRTPHPAAGVAERERFDLSAPRREDDFSHESHHG